MDGLGRLAGAMRGEQDVESVVLRLPAIIRLALKHAVNSRTRLTALVSPTQLVYSANIRLKIMKILYFSSFF